MFLELFKSLKNKSQLRIKAADIKLAPLQTLVGFEGDTPVILDFTNSNSIKILGKMGVGKSTAAEIILEFLKRSTAGIEIIIISLSGDADFKRFKNYEKFKYYNPAFQRDEILQYFIEKNKEVQNILFKMSEENVRHAKDLPDFQPTVIFIDELESSFSTEKDAGEYKKINEQIIGQLNEFFKLSRKLGKILIVATQTQTLSASALSLRLMHYTLTAQLQTKALCEELQIDPKIGLDPTLTEGKFILIGQERLKIIKVPRFEK